jgi:23S rRNA U2552 (ribose-2'-O)-methylase RlmE/FtsJ/DNA-directed RNA polymerase subunit E'/Rpb7
MDLYKINIINTCVEIEPKDINRELNYKILNKLKRLYECRCHPHYGYIKKNSIKILERSIGTLRPNSFTGSFLFNVKIEIQSIKPHEGDLIQCIISKKNDSGLMATTYNIPFNIYILKDFEENEDIKKQINDIEDKSIIEIKVAGAELDAKLNKYNIIGNLHRTISLFNKDYSLLSNNNELNITSINAYLAEYKEETITEYISLKAYKKLKELKLQIGKLKSNELIQQIIIKDGIISNKFGTSVYNGKKFWNLIKNLIYEYSELENEKMYWFKEHIISRAFFKMIEILNSFNLFHNKNMTILNMAESPGGFVQSILYMRKLYGNYKDNYSVVSIAENGKLELWDREDSIIKYLTDLSAVDYFGEIQFTSAQQDNFISINLVDKSFGDLLQLNTHDYINNMYKKRGTKADLITADGAFGFNEGDEEYNNQEIRHYPLFIGEIIGALSNQAVGGHFVLKMFDILSDVSIKLLFILNNCYEIVKIFKPDTSRSANSEKYIICMNFIQVENLEEIILKLRALLEQYNSLCNTAKCPDIEDNTPKYINFTIDIEIPDDFIQSVKIYNDMFIKNEIANINMGLDIGNDLIKMLIDNNMRVDKLNDYIEAKNSVKKTATKLFIKKNLLPEL